MKSTSSIERSALFESSPWQMTFGERAALEGILAQLKPALAIEIGTAEGGSLARVAAYSTEVHSFDLVEPLAEARALPNVTFHTGDNHVLLPEVLARLTDAGRNVDFVLVDGDHSAAGVRKDLEDLLASPAIGQTVILMHDSINPEVRAGLTAVDYFGYAKVRYLELDMVAGELSSNPLHFDQMWGGLGLVWVDSEWGAAGQNQSRRFEPFDLIQAARAVKQATGDPAGAGLVAATEELIARADRAEADVRALKGSASWRVTEPLRAVKRALRRA